jgi:predicted SAM-dependent methyltransferase
MKEKIVLDIGCGENKLEGAIGIDIHRTKDVDIIADARYLPFKEEVFDHIYSSHLLEHFSHREVKDVLEEWVRVLKKAGTIEIKVPWLRMRALIFFLRPTWENIVHIYGGQEHEGNYHKCGFSYRLLKKLLEECGIKNIKRVIKGYKGILFIPDCLHVKGVKKS